jgi:hypothetical protein
VVGVWAVVVLLAGPGWCWLVRCRCSESAADATRQPEETADGRQAIAASLHGAWRGLAHCTASPADMARFCALPNLNRTGAGSC